MGHAARKHAQKFSLGSFCAELEAHLLALHRSSTADVQVCCNRTPSRVFCALLAALALAAFVVIQALAIYGATKVFMQ